MLLISEKIIKVINSEIKSQNSLLKLLEDREKNYHTDHSQDKEKINKSLQFYNKILEESKGGSE